MKKLIYSLFIVFVSLLGGLSWTTEASSSAVADYLVQIGELSYEKGNIEEAVNEFTKALLLDPNQEKAHQYLDNIGHAQGATIQRQTSARRLDELTREVELYQKMLAHVEEQRKDIDGKLNKLTVTHESVLKDNQFKDAQLKDVQLKVKQMGINLENVKKEHDSAVSLRKDFPVVEQSQKIVVKELNHPDAGVFHPETLTYAQLNQKISQSLDVSLDQADQLLALNRENISLQKDLQSQKSSQQNALEVMEDYLYLQEARMNDVANQSVISGLDQVEKHQQLLNREEILNDSNNLLEAVANKINERDIVIQQKNLQINDLQKRLEWYQKSFEAPANPQL